MLPGFVCLLLCLGLLFCLFDYVAVCLFVCKFVCFYVACVCLFVFMFGLVVLLVCLPCLYCQVLFIFQHGFHSPFCRPAARGCDMSDQDVLFGSNFN